MKKKNAFTLIELLAIIVILAIIAVITVPIILNIIENSKKGAAQDSAYGYKDAVNKWYVTELSKPDNQNFNLSSSYTVEDGKIIDDSVQNDAGVLIPFSGDKPSSGELHYSNNVFQGGCLVFGDYAVTFETDGTISTVKGDCSDYKFVDPNMLTMEEMCPGCEFIYTTEDNYSVSFSEMPSGTTPDYTQIASSHPYFLGLIANPSTNIIERAFVCGIDGTTPFCLEGQDDSKWSTDANINVLNKIFSCNISTSDNYASTFSNNMITSNCSSSELSIYADNGGYIQVENNDGACNVDSDYHATCW